MLGWTLSVVIIVSLVGLGIGGLAAPRAFARLYGIVLDDERALAFIRAMGARDVVIGALLAVIALQRRSAPLGWGLCLTALVAVTDYAVVTADRRAAASGGSVTMDARPLHVMGAVGLIVAGTLLFLG